MDIGEAIDEPVIVIEPEEEPVPQEISIPEPVETPA